MPDLTLTAMPGQLKLPAAMSRDTCPACGSRQALQKHWLQCRGSGQQGTAAWKLSTIAEASGLSLTPTALGLEAAVLAQDALTVFLMARLGPGRMLPS